MVLRANSSQQTAGVERRQGALKIGKLTLGTSPKRLLVLLTVSIDQWMPPGQNQVLRG